MSAAPAPGLGIFDLTGKTAVVTGGSRGIGLAIAHQLSRSGARVAIAGRTERTLAEAAKEIGDGTEVFVADVSDEESVENLLAGCKRSFGGVDVLVNNAGINPFYQRTEDTSLGEWSTIIDVNLTGVFLCLRVFGRHMLARGRGSIINITSIAGSVGLSRTAAYCAAKAGVESMTRSLALDWTKRGIRVNCVAPGYAETDLTSGLVKNDRLKDLVIERTPMGRLARAEEMAGAVAFLAADASSYVSGATLKVDGGWTAV